MELKVLIKKIRGERSLRTFAEELGVSHATLHNWEKGVNLPPKDQLEKLGIEGIYRRKKTA